MNGKVLRFGAKGFGFIEVDGSRKSIYFHISDTADGNTVHHEGDIVSFEIGTNPRGEYATKVRLLTAAVETSSAEV